MRLLETSHEELAAARTPIDTGHYRPAQPPDREDAQRAIEAAHHVIERVQRMLRRDLERNRERDGVELEP